MKKLRILLILLVLPLITSCGKIISNPDIRTLSQKASELMDAGDYKGAISRLESINDLNSNLPEIHYNLGIAYYNDEDYEKSIQHLKDALKINPKLTDSNYTIALAYQGLYEKQINEIDNPKKEDENNISYENDTMPLTKKEKMGKAIENLQNAKLFFQNYIDSLNNQDEKDKISVEVLNIDKDIEDVQSRLDKM